MCCSSLRHCQAWERSLHMVLYYLFFVYCTGTREWQNPAMLYHFFFYRRYYWKMKYGYFLQVFIFITNFLPIYIFSIHLLLILFQVWLVMYYDSFFVFFTLFYHFKRDKMIDFSTQLYLPILILLFFLNIYSIFTATLFPCDYSATGR